MDTKENSFDSNKSFSEVLGTCFMGDSSPKLDTFYFWSVVHPVYLAEQGIRSLCNSVKAMGNLNKFRSYQLLQSIFDMQNISNGISIMGLKSDMIMGWMILGAINFFCCLEKLPQKPESQ